MNNHTQIIDILKEQLLSEVFEILLKVHVLLTEASSGRRRHFCSGLSVSHFLRGRVEN